MRCDAILASRGLLVLAILAILPVSGTVAAQKFRKARTISRESAKQATKEFARLYKSKDPRIRLAAVDSLTTLKHQLVAKSLARVLSRDRTIKVRAGAATRLGLQDPAHGYKPLLKAWKSEARKKKGDDVRIAVLEAWRRMGKVPSLKVLTDNWDRNSKEVQKAVIQTSALIRDVKTVAWLATLMDSPAPVNVDSGSNPPAAYWKAKLIRWRFWAIHVQDALGELTDQDFESAGEVKQWIRKGGKILVRKKKER